MACTQADWAEMLMRMYTRWGEREGFKVHMLEYQEGEVAGIKSATLSIERCDFVIKIPTRFCVNVAIAGAIVMYDRVAHMSRFADRPVRAGGPTEPIVHHRHGERFQRTASDETADGAK